ncbi:hypothetical protein FH972_004455 [Carpinus fangiana]|uniref:Uncharacterized protein n=1 Tax=Carpinus fangiana TaxID=176857 RepID=A0A5N6QN17_9ROSI|nr:hypothetical protein FH972_004455 [Carpinus fangiana]
MRMEHKVAVSTEERKSFSAHKDIQTSLSLLRIGEKDKPIWVASRSRIYSSSDTWKAGRQLGRNVMQWIGFL